MYIIYIVLSIIHLYMYVEVVRGDIILLETGDVVPADLRLITAQDLKALGLVGCLL